MVVETAKPTPPEPFEARPLGRSRLFHLSDVAGVPISVVTSPYPAELGSMDLPAMQVSPNEVSLTGLEQVVTAFNAVNDFAAKRLREPFDSAFDVWLSEGNETTDYHLKLQGRQAKAVMKALKSASKRGETESAQPRDITARDMLEHASYNSAEEKQPLRASLVEIAHKIRPALRHGRGRYSSQPGF